MSETLNSLKLQMDAGIVSISYKKLSGEKRDARATRSASIIISNGGTPPEKWIDRSDTTAYFDLDKKAFRSFKKDAVKTLD